MTRPTVGRTDRMGVDIRALPPEERASWQARLDRLDRACGCEEGAVGLVAGFVASALALWLQPGGIRATGSGDIGWASVVMIAAAAAGKAFGLWRARRRSRQVIAELNAVLRAKNVSS
jgi:hypothetical protein